MKKLNLAKETVFRLTDAELSKKKVTELRKIVTDLKLSDKNLLEKDDFVTAIKEYRDTHSSSGTGAGGSEL